LLEEAAFAFFPVAAFSFRKAALVSFFAGFAVFFVGEAAAFGFGEDFGGGVVLVSGLGDGGADAFFEKFDNLNAALVGIVGRGNFEEVAEFEGGAGFERGASSFDFAGGAIVRSFAAGFVEADGPEPLIDAHFLGAVFFLSRAWGLAG
jgi:hypothetical protein